MRPASGLTGGHSDGPSLGVVASERSRLFNPRHSRTTSLHEKEGNQWENMDCANSLSGRS